MNILETHHIVKDYAQHRALNDVSLTIPEGSIYGLLGPNGAGKTSLIRIINQITAPDQGHVIFNGEQLQQKHIRQIGYLPEERGLYKKMKVGEQLLYLAQLKGLDKKTAMEKLKSWFIKFDIKTWWDKNVADLSKGMQQKVQFVSTVLHEPKLIILDEPFSGFDPINANLIRDEILELKEKGSTIIFSTHRMETVEELCDYIALIDKSRKILEGPKEQIKRQFTDNTYLVEFIGEPDLIPAIYNPKSTNSRDSEYHTINIQLPEYFTVNQMLADLIEKVEIRSFRENIPTMNQIFVSSVGRIPEH